MISFAVMFVVTTDLGTERNDHWFDYRFRIMRDWMDVHDFVSQETV